MVSTSCQFPNTKIAQVAFVKLVKIHCTHSSLEWNHAVKGSHTHTHLPTAQSLQLLFSFRGVSFSEAVLFGSAKHKSPFLWKKHTLFLKGMFKRLIRFTRRWCRRWVQVFLREATHCSLELHRNAAAKVRREKTTKGKKMGQSFLQLRADFFFGAGVFFWGSFFKDPICTTRYELQCFCCHTVWHDFVQQQLFLGNWILQNKRRCGLKLDQEGKWTF